ncbi:HAD family hydrolase [Specibacter sp. RAF43]|uniref:HAD family hydrolase n=1 Tax=Specibacter sp. RAF43 TaxID=3233057 RepID=UPI003F9A17C6
MSLKHANPTNPTPARRHGAGGRVGPGPRAFPRWLTDAKPTSRWLDVATALPLLRAAVIDLDGTLLNSNHQLSPATRTAVTEARESGLELVLASSRAPAAMYPILEDLGLLDPVVFVASQGAITASYTAAGELRIATRTSIPLGPARAILAAARRLDLTVNWFSGERWLASRLDDQVRREAGIVGHLPETEDLTGMREGPDKILFMVAAHDRDKLARLTGLLPAAVDTQISNPGYLEVTRRGVDKASAVRALCAQWGMPAADVVAFGDGPNDLGLFAYAGLSIAPLNARPAVLDAARLITFSNDDDGVALALGHILKRNERRHQP